MNHETRSEEVRDAPEVSGESRELDARVQRYGAAQIEARLRPMLAARRLERIEQVVSARLKSVMVAVEHAYDPHNAAAVVRTADVFGVRDVHVIAASERVLRAKHTTRGVSQWMHTFGWPDIESFARSMSAGGIELLAAVPDGGVPVDQVDMTRPACLLLGNEHSGLSARALELCTRKVTVPMWGYSDSLNLSVCAALCLRTLSERRRAAIGARGDLRGLDYQHELVRHLCIAIDPRILEVYFPMPSRHPTPPATQPASILGASEDDRVSSFGVEDTHL